MCSSRYGQQMCEVWSLYVKRKWSFCENSTNFKVRIWTDFWPENQYRCSPGHGQHLHEVSSLYFKMKWSYDAETVQNISPNLTLTFDTKIKYNAKRSIPTHPTFFNHQMPIVTFTFDMWPPKSIKFILSPWFTCLQSSMKKHTTSKSLW